LLNEKKIYNFYAITVLISQSPQTTSKIEVVHHVRKNEATFKAFTKVCGVRRHYVFIPGGPVMLT